jgi:hypothetical protein
MSSKQQSSQRHAGQVLTFDFQSDVHGGQYQLVERTAPSTWTAVRLPPSETEIASINSDPWYVAHGGADVAIADRFALAGVAFKITFVSARRWAEYF